MTLTQRLSCDVAPPAHAGGSHHREHCVIAAKGNHAASLYGSKKVLPKLSKTK